MISAGDLIHHEIIPGHYFEDTLRRENRKLSGFRRLDDPDAFAEGWAEYASQLAGEMGMYADPYDRLGRLCGEMFMSIRMVVDTGMNKFGWSRQKAMDYMRTNSCQSEQELETESLRYGVDLPGHALTYHLPNMEFTRLREIVQKQLGTKFDIRDFHEAILGASSPSCSTLTRSCRRRSAVRIPWRWRRITPSSATSSPFGSVRPERAKARRKVSLHIQARL